MRENPQLAFRRRAPPPPPNSWLTSGLLGVELEVRGATMVPTTGAAPVISSNPYAGKGVPANLVPVATGDVLMGTEQPFGNDPVGLSVAAGYRFLPFLSAGIFFDYAGFQAQDGTDSGDYRDKVGQTTSQMQRQVWKLGVYGRYYLTMLSPTLHPWVEVGVGYSNDTVSYEHDAGSTTTGQPLTTDYYLTQKGVVTNLRVGLDWRLAPIFSLGPVLGYERVFPVSGCVDIEPQADAQNPNLLPSVTTCDSSVVQSTAYGVVMGGIFAKVTLGPDVR